MNDKKKPYYISLLIISTFLWGSSYPIGKNLLDQINSSTLVFFRLLIASLILAIYIKFSREKFSKLSWTQWIWTIIISSLGVGGFNIIIFSGLAYTNPTNASLIMSFSPLLTSLIVCFMHRRPPPKDKIIGLLLGIFGVFIVITNGNIQSTFYSKINYGDILIFIGMVCWSIYTYCCNPISKWMPTSQFTFVGIISGAAISGIAYHLTSPIPLFEELKNINSITMIGVIYIGLFGTVISYFCWLKGVHHLGALTASSFFNFIPIFSLLTASLLGNPISEIQALGVIVVIFGLSIPHLNEVLFKKN